MTEGLAHGSTSLIEYGPLESGADEFRERYAAARPWRHIQIDSLLHVDVARAAMSTFPPFGASKSVLARFLEARQYGADETPAPIFESIFDELHGPRFIAWLENVTGIPELSADRRHVGAGFHQGGRGSYLRLHADHNCHPSDPTRYRRLSLLLYLNERWDSRWNGALELWDERAAKREKSIEPLLNRCVVMETGDRNFHAYGPLRSPKGTTRKALAVYYYSSQPGTGQLEDAHDTIWPKRLGEHPLERLNHDARRTLLWYIERALGRKRSDY